MSKKIFSIITGMLLCSVMVGCGAVNTDASKESDKKTETAAKETKSEEKNDDLYQVSLLNGLMLGDYDGSVTIGELLKHGDTGLGTFDKLDGEMIVIDGAVYKAKSDGTVEKQPDSEKTPFAAVGFLDSDYTVEGLDGITNLEQLKTLLDKEVTEKIGDKNAFYLVRIDGDFSLAHVRSVPKQEKPYRKLNDIAAEQKEYKYNDVKGSIIALYCPDYMQGINLPTWHFHFLTDEKDKGGHLLDINIKSAKGVADKIQDYNLVLPTSDTFANMELATDLSKETKKTESK